MTFFNDEHSYTRKTFFRAGSGLLIPVILFFLLTGCDAVRILWWNKPNVDDYRKFPVARVEAPSSGDRQFSFTEAADLSLPPMTVNSDKGTLSLDSFLQATQTTAWLVMIGDTLVTEHYAPGWNKQSLLTSFSVAKSFVGTLVGIAVDEGAISSVDQPVSDFLPQLSDRGFRKVTLRHLLNMRSGVDFYEGYSSPFSPMPRLYYGRKVSHQVEKLRVKTSPDSVYEYQSINTQLLSMALEKATGMSVAAYLQQKIWIPLGMESDALWNMASRADSTVKSFCCLNAIGRDYLRFGRLWMNRGQWNGRQIVSANWVAETLSDTLNSKDSRGYAYSRQWRILPDGAMFAKGVLGQYIWVNPRLKIVVARFGKSDAATDWVKVFRAAEKYYFSGSFSKKRL